MSDLTLWILSAVLALALVIGGVAALFGLVALIFRAPSLFRALLRRRGIGPFELGAAYRGVPGLRAPAHANRSTVTYIDRTRNAASTGMAWRRVLGAWGPRPSSRLASGDQRLEERVAHGDTPSERSAPAEERGIGSSGGLSQWAQPTAPRERKHKRGRTRRQVRKTHNGR